LILLASLWAHERIVGIKEAVPDMGRVSKLLNLMADLCAAAGRGEWSRAESIENRSGIYSTD